MCLSCYYCEGVGQKEKGARFDLLELASMVAVGRGRRVSGLWSCWGFPLPSTGIRMMILLALKSSRVFLKNSFFGHIERR